jgi:hypothetical protein
VILVNLKENDRLVAVELVSAEDLEQYGHVQPQQRVAPPSPLEADDSVEEEEIEEEPEPEDDVPEEE